MYVLFQIIKWRRKKDGCVEAREIVPPLSLSSVVAHADERKALVLSLDTLYSFAHLVLAKPIARDV